MLREEIIPKKDGDISMPDRIVTPYIGTVFGEAEELTEIRLQTLVQQIQNGESLGIILGQDFDFEEDYMQIEIDGGRICFQYIRDIGTDAECFYSSFDPDFLDSEEEAPINCTDGQSVLLMRHTMQDPVLAAKCVEYFARTGALYPGMTWLKGSWDARE